MPPMNTPGVYIVELNAFPNSVVEVATAVPAFIGHTERANDGNTPLHNKATRITSMSEYTLYFGGGHLSQFTLTALSAAAPAASGAPAAGPAPTATPAVADFVIETGKGPQAYTLTQNAPNINYLLHRAMNLFFQNGGGACYIVSVGTYDNQALNSGDFLAGIGALLKEQEPTMVVIPDAVNLGQPDCITVQQAMLKHCGEDMKNRVAILDIWGGDQAQTPSNDPVANFRNNLGINDLDFGAAYYPWLNTTIVTQQNLGCGNLDDASKQALIPLLQADLGLPAALPANPSANLKDLWQAVTDITKDWTKVDWTKETPPVNPSDIVAVAAATAAGQKLNSSILANAKSTAPSAAAPGTLYGTIINLVQAKLNLLPPSAAMAGVYTAVDNSRGVWKAPANVSLNSVISPTVPISDADQDGLNVSAQGKSVNAIRSFIGEGVLVWGARTLDGNSQDWRYINVRRTMIMLEESCRLAAKAMVFEPNVAGTWVNIRSMIENFLTGVWKQGGLAGAVPTDAFSVQVGLGTTMTADDILNGILRVTVLVAISRPAEFIQITFQQQMQKS